MEDGFDVDAFTLGCKDTGYGHLSVVSFCRQPRRGKPLITLYTLQSISRMRPVQHRKHQITSWAATKISRSLHSKDPRWAYCLGYTIPRDAQLRFLLSVSLPAGCEGLIRLQQGYTGIC